MEISSIRSFYSYSSIVSANVFRPGLTLFTLMSSLLIESWSNGILPLFSSFFHAFMSFRYKYSEKR